MQNDREARKMRGLKNLIGNTPLLAIQCTVRGKPRTVYAKAENHNMTGSIKDRMAYYIIEQAYQSGKLREHDRIVEATSGNTGISFSAIGKALGHPVTIYMPDWMSEERKNLIRIFGADIILIGQEQGGFLGSISRAEEEARNNADVFLPRQFSNNDNSRAHYLSTGPELWWQLQFRSLYPSAFVAGVGTGGTVMGVGQYLKEKYPAVKLHPLEPSNSPTLSTGHKVGKHRIQGISDEFIPPILDLDFLDEVVCVDDGDSIIMAQRLSKELGLGVGISSGANFLGAVKIAEQMDDDAVVVTIFPDDNKKYLSTDLLRNEPVKDDFISPEIELQGFCAYKRVCFTCCDPQECVEVADVDVTKEAQFPQCPRRSP